MRKQIQLQSAGEKTLAEAFEQFIQCKVAMNVSEDTIIDYRNCYKYFVAFFGEGRQCAEVSEQTIIDYLYFTRTTKPHLAQKTVSTYLRGLRTIFYFMMKSGWMDEFKIQLPKVEQTIKETYSEQEV